MENNRLKIVADDKIPFLRGVLEPYALVEYLAGGETTSEVVRNADALITRTRTVCDRRLLEDSSVRLIATATIGHDHINAHYCDSQGIRWSNAPGCNASSVQQYMVAALLHWAHIRRRNLKELTLGVVGVGNVGRLVVKAGIALGMKVLENDPPRAEREAENGFVELEELLAKSDIITCHLPLEREGKHATFHLADDDFFAHTKRGVLFVNTGRGEVTDSEALRKAYAARHVVDYILDVWEDEPIIDLPLLRNACIATPHIAGYSADGKANGTAVCVDAIAKEFGIEALVGWYPKEIPHPQMEQVIEIDCDKKSDQEVAFEAVRHTYNIEEDSDRLKRTPLEFEQQRGDYWVRREFSYFTVRLVRGTLQQMRLLCDLGFKVE